MLLTQDVLNNFFDDSFAIRKMNKINYTDDVTHDDDGATIKLKVPGFNKKSIDISVDSETYEVRADGNLLTCKPATELPLAQRYFLF